MEKRGFFIILTIALATVAGRAGAEIRLISSDAGSAVIEYRSDEPVFSPAGDGFSLLRLDKTQVFGQPGEPGLPECQVHLAVPEGSLVRSEVVSSDLKEYSGIRLAPVPTLEPDQDGIGQETYLADRQAYAKTEFLPAELARVVSVGPLRQLTVARVSIRPAQYSAASGALRVFTSLRVRITWSGGAAGGAMVDDKAFEPVLERLVLNFAAARDWGKRGGSGPGKGADPFAGAQLWYKLSVARDGLYRLSYTDLKLNGINPDFIDPRTIKLFTGGSRAFPKNHAAPYPDSMYQVALRVEGEGDGGFGAGDYIMFYGQGMNGWDRNSALPNNQYNNPYDSVNCYWLCWGGDHGLRMAGRNGEPGGGAPVPTAFTDTIHFEQDRLNPFNSGELWFWKNMPRYSYEQAKRHSVPFFMPPLSSDAATVRVNLLAGTAGYNHHLQWGVNGNTGRDFTWSGSPASGPRTDQAQVSGLAAGANNFDLDLIKQGSDSSDAVLLNWFEVVYRRPYQAFNRQLRFRADSSYASAVVFRVTGLASDGAAVLDITDPDRPVFISTNRRFPAYTEFQDVPFRRMYFTAAPEAWLTPAAVRPCQPQRLRQTMLGTKYLLIAADELWPQAQALINYHAAQAGQQPARAVKMSVIYDEFGFGLRDPSAVRNFLKHVFLNSAPARTSPAWLCLLGDGSYDYRHIDRNVADQNLVPSHQEDVIEYVLEEYLYKANDDWFAYIDSAQHPQFTVGRMPAKDATEAWTAVNKALSYNQRQGLGPWRNKSLLMADDAKKRTEAILGEWIHTEQAELLSANHFPRAYDLLKVYGEMYPLSSRETKPAATSDLLRYWNQGAGIVHFIGHGAWWVWGHEFYFRHTDVPSLGNGGRLPLVMMASCGTSRFDNPYNDAIGSALVVKPNGGAVATIGAMRETLSGGNNSLAEQFYDAMFSLPDGDLGQAFYLAKVAAGSGYNASFVYLGDPSLRNLDPVGSVNLTLSSDTLLSRGRYMVDGTVSGTGLASGQVQVSVFDIPTRDSTGPYFGTYCKFIRPGKMVFQGLASVRNDSFSLSFNVPDLLYNNPVSGVRISAYAWNDPADAAGATAGAIWIGGVDTTRPNDHRGPSIDVSINGLPVAAGDTIDPTAHMTVRISDPLGINIAPGVVPMGEIRLRFDNGDYSDLSQLFLYESGSDSSGTVSLTKTFTDGNHAIRIDAYDCLLNKTTWERSITVAGTLQLSVESAFNYPNPFRDQTWFTFKIRQAADVAIKVFTVAGRLIKTLEAKSLAAGYNQVRWDGRDGDGDPLANGVYLYKVVAKNPGGEASVFGRLTVMR